MSTALRDFDRIYVINLPSRADRRREIAEQLARIGLALDRPPLQLFPAVRPQDAGPFPTIGTRGCFMSHLGVLEDALRAGHRRILVLEDDVDFAADFEPRMAVAAERLRQQPWGVFYGGHLLKDPAPLGSGDDVLREAPPGVPIVTSYFVAFAGETIGAMVDHLRRMLERPAGDPDGGPMHVDGAYSWFRARHPRVRTLVSPTPLAHQRASRTDVHALPWYDRWPVVRDVVEALRRRRRA